MEYINIPLHVIRSGAYVGADPVQRATWLSLIAWSCDQENNGRIVGARDWGDRRWMQSCGVMAAEVASGCGLFEWDGDDLVVAFYPSDAQAEVERKRVVARTNGRKGGRRPAQTADSQEADTVTFVSEPTSVTDIGTDVENQCRLANDDAWASEKKRKEKKGNSVVTTTVVNTEGAGVVQYVDDARSADGFARFVQGCLSVCPSWAKLTPTGYELGAAKEAYGACKGRLSPKDLELLRAYYASSMVEDRTGKRFWRPDSRRQFWEGFADVWAHAERWAKEAHWGRKTVAVKPVAVARADDDGKPPGEGSGLCSAEDLEEFREFRKEMGL